MADKYYAGIGARDTPADVLESMTSFSRVLYDIGYTLRSGGARGADTSFANNAMRRELFRPNDIVTADRFDRWSDVAAQHHAAWEQCDAYARKCHARNAAIILGGDLDTPVDFVVCWTERGRFIGGTGLAMRIAKAHNIDIYNLATDGAQRLRERLAEF